MSGVQVLKETKQLCTSAVEPLVSSVDAMRQYGVDKVCNVVCFEMKICYC